MSHVTSAMPARVVLDWRRAITGPLEPCVLCGVRTVCRSPATGVPCHKGCAETWITAYARSATGRARLICRYTPGRGEPR